MGRGPGFSPLIPQSPSIPLIDSPEARWQRSLGNVVFRGRTRNGAGQWLACPCLNFFTQDYVFSCLTTHGTEFLMVEVDDTKQLIRLSLAETSCSFNKHWLKAHYVQDTAQSSESYTCLFPCPHRIVVGCLLK